VEERGQMKASNLPMIIEVAILILKAITQQFSPLVRTEVERLVLALNVKAKTTPSKFDDLGVSVLADILNVRLPE